MVIFTVQGEPKGKARPRITRHGNYTPQKTKDYEALVAQAFIERANGTCWKNAQPLSIKIVARFGIPKSTKKCVRQAIYNKQILPTKKPDIDNIAKIIMDGLNGIAYTDDNQICELTVCKEYVVEGMQPHVVVFIGELRSEQIGWVD